MYGAPHVLQPANLSPVKALAKLDKNENTI